MIDNQQFNAILTDPKTQIRIEPVINPNRITSSFYDSKIPDYSNLNRTKYLQQQYQAMYQHQQVGVAFLNSDLDVTKLMPPQKIIDKVHLLKQLGNAYAFNDSDELLMALRSKSNSNSDSYYITEYASATGKQLANQVMGHQYKNQSDHVFAYSLFYDDYKPSVLMISSSDMFEDSEYNNPMYQYSNRSEVTDDDKAYTMMIDDQTVMESVTHPMIDAYLDLIDRYKDLPNLTERDEQDIEYFVNNDAYQFDRKFITKNMMAWKKYKQYTNESNGYPNALLDLYAPYNNQTGHYELAPNTWIAKQFDVITDLSAKRKQLIVDNMVMLLGPDRYIEPRNHVDYVPIEDTNDNLINVSNEFIHGDNTIAGVEDLPVLNDNSFIKQLSVLSDQNILYDKHSETTYTKTENIKSLTIPFTNQSLQSNMIGKEYDGYHSTPGYNDSISNVYYGPHYQITKLENAYRSDVLIASTDKAHKTEALTDIKSYLSTHHGNWMVNMYEYASGHVDMIFTMTTQDINKLIIMVPLRAFYNANDAFEVRLNQTNLKTLNPLTIDWNRIDANGGNTSIVNNILQHTMQQYVELAIPPFDIKSNKYSILKDRKQAITDDPKLQQYLLSL